MMAWIPVLVLLLACLHVGARLWLWLGVRRSIKSENTRKAQFRNLPVEEQEKLLPVLSVVIAARNEAKNLRTHLPSILRQDYPEFEVIIALDRCEDESEDILKSFAKSHLNLHWITVAKTPLDWAPKKWALTQAIALVNHPNLVCTDADCGAEEGWLEAVGIAFANGASVVPGLGMYYAYPGFLNRFIRYETSYTALQYLGAAGNYVPYMGVGRNLSYKKEVFDAVGGFVDFRKSLSGDDDLLVNAWRNDGNTISVIGKGSRSWSEPKRTFGSWLRQKGRHFSASAKYTALSKIALAIFHGSQIAFYGFLALFLVSGGHIGVGLGLYLCYLLGSWYIFGLFAKETNQTDLITVFPLLDFAYACYHFFTAPFGLLAQPSWQKNQNPKYPKTPSRTVD